MSNLADRVLAGDLRAIARAISVVEDEEGAADTLVKALFPHSGRAYVVGVTGPPGAGKSTLVDRLTGEYRKRGSTVGVIFALPPEADRTAGCAGPHLFASTHAWVPAFCPRNEFDDSVRQTVVPPSLAGRGS